VPQWIHGCHACILAKTDFFSAQNLVVSGQNGFNSNSEAKGHCAQTYDGQESTPCPETVASSEDRCMSMSKAKAQINL
jgi:hypothetical protein